MKPPLSINAHRQSETENDDEEGEEFNPHPQIGLHKDENNKYLLTGKKFDSLDILSPDTNAYLGMGYTKTDAVINWLNFFLLGLFTGIVAFGID